MGAGSKSWDRSCTPEHSTRSPLLPGHHGVLPAAPPSVRGRYWWVKEARRPGDAAALRQGSATWAVVLFGSGLNGGAPVPGQGLVPEGAPCWFHRGSPD